MRISSNSQISEVAVHGWDPKAKREIVASTKGTGVIGEGARKHGGGAKLSIAGDHTPADVATSEKMAKGRMRKLAEGFVRVHAEMIGNPEIVPGELVTFDKLGPEIDGQYRVEHAAHTFSRHGYFVSFRAVRVAKKKPPKPPPATRTQHWAQFGFLDAAGRPISGARYKMRLPDGRKLSGSLDSQGRTTRHQQLPQGAAHVELADITQAEPVELTIASTGLDAGVSVRFEIFRLYRERRSEVVATLQGKIDDRGGARAKWTPSSIQEPDDTFVFKATAAGTWRKSGSLIVRHRASGAEWSVAHAGEGEQVTLSADLHGIPDGQSATIQILEKSWRVAQDGVVQTITATVRGGAIEARWTVPTATKPKHRGLVPAREFYFTVEAGGLHCTSTLLLVI